MHAEISQFNKAGTFTSTFIQTKVKFSRGLWPRWCTMHVFSLINKNSDSKESVLDMKIPTFRGKNN